MPSLLPGLSGQPDLVIDLATLTGAQLVATGKRHAAIVSNTEELERAAVAAGRRSGDMVHPLPFVPEFYRKEFKSKVPRPRPPSPEPPLPPSSEPPLPPSLLAPRLAPPTSPTITVPSLAPFFRWRT